MAYNPKRFSEYLSEETNEITFVFGRFNPPTNGHEKVFDALKKKAGSGQFRIYASQSNDPKKNPLKFKDKIKFLRKMFPKYARSIMSDSNVRTVFDIVTRLYDQGFTKVNMVVGEDRLTEFDKLLNKYNGEKGRHGFYQFEGGIQVVSAGARDPDSDDVSGMSASKLRAAASANDFNEFSKGMPSGYKDGKELFNAIRKGMGLKESHNHRTHVQLETVSEEREQYKAGKLFSEGDTVVVKESNDVGTITMTGANYVLVEFTDGKKKRCWLDSVEKLDEAKDMPLSKHTKKYKQMFGEEDLEEKKIAGLVKKAEKTGMPYGILKKVYDRGMAAWRTGHRPGSSQQQWAYARVNSFITGGKTRTTGDADLWKQHKGVKEEIVTEEAQLNEVPTPELIDRLKSKTINKNKYKAAFEVLKQVYDRKKKEAKGGSMKHSVDYYAAQVARQYSGVNPRVLAKMHKDSITEQGGAGEEGTPKLIKKYKEYTPCQEDCAEAYEDLVVEASEYQGRKVNLNDPFRLPSGSKKKFGVYVKNDKGNVVKVTFGDPNMEIKRDDPKRRASFRARHDCANKTDKTKAGYWSCYQWRASKKVDN